MGGTHWWDLSGKKRWRKAKNDKKNELYQIARKYNLTQDTKPAYIEDKTPYFTFESFEHDANNYADSKYQHTAFVSGWGAKILTVTLTIVIAVVSALFAAPTGGQSLWAAYSAGSISALVVAAIVGGSVAISLTGLALTTHYTNKSNAKKTQEYITRHREIAQDFKAQAQERSAQLTTLMVYGKYEIYANNAIYNQGRAGDSLESNTFNPSQAYDPTRGMRGDMRQDTKPFDDSAQYRAHTTLAGNRDYMQQTLGLDFPLAQSGFNYNIDSELTQKGLDTRLAQINEGFSELIDKGAGLSFKHSVEKTSNPAKAYKEITELELGFFKNKLALNDFLKKQERYKNGQWADFEFLYFKDVSSQKQSAMQNTINLIQEWDSKESQAYRESLSDEELLKVVIEMMMYSLEVLVEFIDSEITKKSTGIYEDSDELNDYALGHITYELYSEKDTQNYIINDLSLESAQSAKDIKIKFDKLQNAMSRTTFIFNKGKEIHINQIKVPKYFYIYEVLGDIIYYLKLPDDTTKEELDFYNALSKYFWDSRLDSLDLSKYSLKDLGLA